MGKYLRLVLIVLVLAGITASPATAHKKVKNDPQDDCAFSTSCSTLLDLKQTAFSHYRNAAGAMIYVAAFESYTRFPISILEPEDCTGPAGCWGVTFSFDTRLGDHHDREVRVFNQGGRLVAKMFVPGTDPEFVANAIDVNRFDCSNTTPKKCRIVNFTFKKSKFGPIAGELRWAVQSLTEKGNDYSPNCRVNGCLEPWPSHPEVG
jgi:hypothetical protein